MSFVVLIGLLWATLCWFTYAFCVVEFLLWCVVVVVMGTGTLWLRMFCGFRFMLGFGCTLCFVLMWGRLNGAYLVILLWVDCCWGTFGSGWSWTAFELVCFQGVALGFVGCFVSYFVVVWVLVFTIQLCIRVGSVREVW